MLLLNLLKEEKIRTTEPKAEEFEIVLKVSQARTHLKVQLKNSYFMPVYRLRPFDLSFEAFGPEPLGLRSTKLR